MVEAELQCGWGAEDPGANPHGVELARCLLRQPERRNYLDSFNDNQPKQLWLVLEEDPEAHSGYEIVFDETRGEFGLATLGHGAPVFIGYYGTFLDTLAGM